MGDQEHIIEELKTPLQNQARTFEKRLSKIEASREGTGGLQEGSVGGDQPLYSEGAGTGERAGLLPVVEMKESTPVGLGASIHCKVDGM